MSGENNRRDDLAAQEGGFAQVRKGQGAGSSSFKRCGGEGGDSGVQVGKKKEVGGG